MPTWDIPVRGKLVVRLDNGDEWDAKPEDLAKFRLVESGEAYMRFQNWLRDTLHAAGLFDEEHRDITDMALNPIRYAVECALNYPHMPGDHEEDRYILAEVAELERNGRATAEGDTTP